MEEPRIGVFICHCGTNIAGTVDIDEVREFTSGLPGVVSAQDYKFSCSEPGQLQIKETVEKEGGSMVARLIEREGPTGLILTTTWTSLHPENETRMFSLTIRDDPEQTAGVMKALAEKASGEAPAEPDLAPWHAYQEWLQLGGPRNVIIPYASKLAALSGQARELLRQIVRRTTYYDLLGAEDYVDQFRQAMFLPHTYIRLFPSALGAGPAEQKA